MRRQENEIVDRKEIERILERGKIMHLAMCDGAQPYVLPLNYGYKEGKLYFHCAVEGRKLDVLKKNDRVCFAVDLDHNFIKGSRSCRSTVGYRSVVGEGTATIVNSKEEKIEGLNILMKQVFNEPPQSFDEDVLGRLLVVRIDVTTVVGKRSDY